MLEVIFLVCLGLVWITFAVIQDTKTREVANWLNFSLVIFALVFRFFYSLFGYGEFVDFGFFYQGLIWFVVFFIIGNLFYYGRVFAGGDAKLMIALGPVISIYSTFIENVFVIVAFVFIFLISGVLYGLFSSFYIALKNRKRFSIEFRKKIRLHRIEIYLLMLAGLVFAFLGFIIDKLFFYGMIIFVFPYIYFWAKTVDESCMINKVSVRDVSEGEWLFKDIKIGKRVIKAKWEGLSKEEINFIKKHKQEIFIRIGIPFTPVFLISFILTISVIFLI